MAATQIPEVESVQRVLRRVTRQRSTELKELKKRYTELRKIANKRIQRAQAKGQLLDEEMFSTISELMDGEESPVRLVKEYTRVVKFLRSKKSTAKGRKEIAIQKVERLKSVGYDVSISEEQLFSEFMREFRQRFEISTPHGKRYIIDSDFAAEAFDTIKENYNRKGKPLNKNILMRVFDAYLKSKGF